MGSRSEELQSRVWNQIVRAAMFTMHSYFLCPCFIATDDVWRVLHGEREEGEGELLQEGKREKAEKTKIPHTGE